MKIKNASNALYLLRSLSLNDFKSKYAGSYFGFFWMLVQPMVTILVYWFVFEKGLKVTSPDNISAPFILWFISGIIPWFFFSEALATSSNSFIEYNYLVKKVIFRIGILPYVKILSALIMHLFFICILFLFFVAYKYPLDVHVVQIFYYIICNVLLVASISKLTSAITPFFKDFSYILSIILQFGMWLSPILWSTEILSPELAFLFKLNPFYYIVEGFRDSFINQVWFFEKYKITMYFLFILCFNFLVSKKVYSKLKPHLSDVL